MKKLFLLLMIFLSEFALANVPTLIGGKVARQGEFPEVIYISSGRSRCSATVVGPKVILTAAHCLEDGKDITPVAEFVVLNQVFKAKCTHHPEYASKYSHDFALCKTNQEIDVKWATISKEPVELAEQVTLMGFGATIPRNPDGSGGGGGNDGKLRWGLAPVVQLPENSPAGGYQYFYTEGSSALNFGDSGGPVMKKIDDPKTDKHMVIGTNSRGNIRSLSLLSSTFLPNFQNWAMAYTMQHNVEICGINKECHKPAPKKCERERAKIKKWQERLRQCEESEAETMDDIFEMSF
jgi:hypothetical protein